MLSGQPFGRGIYGRSSRQQATELLADAAQRDGCGIRRAKREEPGKGLHPWQASHFVILGIGFTAVFALTLFVIVKLVLHFAGV